MSYLLVIMLGTGLITAEFSSQKKCEAARKQLSAITSIPDITMSRSACVPK